MFDLTRYVDMIANPEVADVFRKRAKVGYQNIQTSILSTSFFCVLITYLSLILC